MLEFIIDTCFWFAVMFLGLFIIDYFIIGGRPLKESVEYGLFIAIFITAMSIARQYKADYQLIVICIVLGIAIFSLKFVFGYYGFKRSLKESVKDGLIKGGGLAILLTIFVKLTDLLYDLIV